MGVIANQLGFADTKITERHLRSMLYHMSLNHNLEIAGAMSVLPLRKAKNSGIGHGLNPHVPPWASRS
jgi:hypothetical protein